MLLILAKGPFESGAIRTDKSAFTMLEVLLPFTRIIIALAVKMVTHAVSLSLTPFTDIQITIVIEAFASSLS